ncbi:MAG TPA: AAA domain-containing protein, partial [Gemmataceae bacterium]|nr:AAA domain-containing protein [Gemmataceae bacterium]
AKVASETVAPKHADGELRAAYDALTRMFEAGQNLTTRTPKELAAWAGEQQQLVEANIAAFEQLVAVLNPGADVETANAAARFHTAATWAKLLADAERARVAVGFAGDLLLALAHDWATEKRLAERLLEYLKSRSTPLSPGHIAGLTDEKARAQIAGAIRESEDVAAKGFDDSWGFVTSSLFDPTADVSTGVTLGKLPINDLAAWCRDRVADSGRLLEWVRYGNAARDATEAGVGAIFDEIRRGEVQLDHAADAFRARFFRQWLDAIDAEVPELRRFAAEDHERTIARFGDLDRQSMRAAATRIRASLLGASARPAQVTDAPSSSEVGILLREVEKARRHLPLRKLFARIPTVLPRVKPCLMMSPLAVSTYLQSPELVFDLVVFDEASQVRPHDAVCAIYRGKQVVVAGDQKQLPPTSFFERSADDEPANDAETISDYESVLDVCCSMGLPRRQLRWHYRSRREGLIAFSNHHFYDNQLVTFPSARDVAGSRAVTFRHVPDGRFADGENEVEARFVAQLVLDHFEKEPTRTLGVIAFSQRQQLRILDELETLRKERPELEEFFQADRDDAFFVKNLENVQGDERDVIMLSVGYGPNASGKVLMNFGPLNRKGGERRLNVAVTRARLSMTVVSSMRGGDIVEARTEARGARLLKAYLDFAEHGPDTLNRRVTEANQRDFDSPFEKEVSEELTRHGLTVHRQVGCGGFRIDLAVLDPDEPGRYLLGVECDGAAYHSSATARDRDRLRQDVLEGLGWRVCRVWSTDWVKNRAAQVQRVLDAVKRCKDGPAVPPPAAPPPAPPPTKASTAKTPKRVEYASIEQVPTLDIERLLTETVTQFGGTGTEDLLKRVTKQLGFKRMGENIKMRLAGVLNDLITSGKFRVSDGDDRIWVK